MISIGMMIMGMHGLKETAFESMVAETPTYYTPISPQATGESLNQAIRLDSPHDNLKPSFTFFIHGLGGDASVWSNDLYYDCNNSTIIGNGNFEWNSKSLLKKIAYEQDAAVYVAKYVSNNHFTYCRYDEKVVNGKIIYDEIEEKRNYLSDTLSHNLIVYESDDAKQSLGDEFNHFEHIVNTLCYDYKRLHGFVPRINLIGHSRGGLVAQKYVNEYPYNVYGYYNIGTPYRGSNSTELAIKIKNTIGNIFNLNDNDDFTFASAAHRDFLNKKLFNDLMNDWNSLKSDEQNYLSLTGKSYAGVMTLDYAKEMIFKACQEHSVQIDDYYVRAVTDLLDDIKELCITDYSGQNYNINALLTYRDYRNACSKLSSAAKSSIRDLIYSKISTIIQELTEEDIEKYQFVPILRWLVKYAVCPTANSLLKMTFFESQVIPFIVDSLASFNGNVAIFESDGLVSLESQWAEGYQGQETYVKVFDERYLQLSTITPTMDDVLAGHNLETFDNDITNDIVVKGKFPSYDELHYNIVFGDEGKATYSPLNNGPIADTVVLFEIDGKNLGNNLVINPRLEIENRETDLTIRLTNFKTVVGVSSSYESKPFIEYLGSHRFNLTIEYEGTNSFTYSSSYFRQSDSPKYPVIRCRNVNIKFEPLTTNSSLVLKAANGGNAIFNSLSDKPGQVLTDSNRNGYNGENGANGNDGASGSNCVDCKAIDLSCARNLTLQGGNGGNGSRGGHGGSGANGKTLPGGYKGGNGGNGGRGGNGGHGGDGGLAIYCENVTLADNDYVSSGIKLYPGKPGNGANGGNGGNGGKGANGSWFQFLWVNNDYAGGNGGNGGLVGYGGCSGIPSCGNASFDNIDAYWEMVDQAIDKGLLSASGGYGGSVYGNGGNSGFGSREKHNYDGIPGKAVESYNVLNGMYGMRSSLFMSSPDGQIYILTNGKGYDNSGMEVWYNKQATKYGKSGVAEYFHNP